MARLVFDLDGTLIDSAPDICTAANSLLADRGLAPVTLSETIGFIGNGAGVLIEKLRAARGLADSEQAIMLDKFKARYTQDHHLTRVYPGVIEALTQLRTQGHRLGLCTNKPHAPALAVLAHLDLAKFFETVWAGDSLPQRKPDPAPLRAAFQALGQGQCLYIGDSEVDAETARRAEVPFLLFTEGYRKQPVQELPHAAIFSAFSTLPDLVEAQLSTLV